MIDTHCHLDFPPFAGKVKRVLAEAREAGVTTIINPGTSGRTSRTAVELAEQYAGQSDERAEVWAAIGIHPTEKEQVSFADFDDWRALAAHRRVVAIGEVGLDYHHAREYPDDTPSMHDQRVLFEQFVLIAEEAGKPLIIHAREAHADALSVVRAVASQEPILIFHSFDGDQETARLLLDAGAYLGFNNLLTYPKNDALRQVAAWTPLDRILIETDAPFLPPQSRRGEVTMPADVRSVAEQIATLHRRSIEEIDTVTSHTARAIFQLH